MWFFFIIKCNILKAEILVIECAMLFSVQYLVDNVIKNLSSQEVPDAKIRHYCSRQLRRECLQNIQQSHLQLSFLYSNKQWSHRHILLFFLECSQYFQYSANFYLIVALYELVYVFAAFNIQLEILIDSSTCIINAVWNWYHIKSL